MCFSYFINSIAVSAVIVSAFIIGGLSLFSGLFLFRFALLFVLVFRTVVDFFRSILGRLDFSVFFLDRAILEIIWVRGTLSGLVLTVAFGIIVKGGKTFGLISLLRLFFTRVVAHLLVLFLIFRSKVLILFILVDFFRLVLVFISNRLLLLFGFSFFFLLLLLNARFGLKLLFRGGH